MPALLGIPHLLPTTSRRHWKSWVQRRAARWVKLTKLQGWSACMDTMRQQLHWPTLEKQWWKQACLTTLLQVPPCHGFIHIVKILPFKIRPRQHTHNLTSTTFRGHPTRLCTDGWPFLGPSQSVTAFRKKWPQAKEPGGCHQAPSRPGSALSLKTTSVTSINEKWVSKGWSCACWGLSPGTAKVARSV